MKEMEKFNITVTDLTEDGREATFVVEPLVSGYGITIGNSLRRVLLSTIPGYAATSIRIDGVLHAHFTLNGKKVSIPSILVKAGDVIAVKETSKESTKIKALGESMATAQAPKWLENDVANHATKVVALPQREDIDFDFEEQLIVELYSK